MDESSHPADEQLFDYAAGSAMPAVAEHLASCAACSELVAASQSVQPMLASAHVRMSRAQSKKLLRAVRSEHRLLHPQRRFSWSMPRFAPALAGAAVSILVAVSVVSNLDTGTSSQTSGGSAGTATSAQRQAAPSELTKEGAQESSAGLDSIAPSSDSALATPPAQACHFEFLDAQSPPHTALEALTHLRVVCISTTTTPSGP